MQIANQTTINKKWLSKQEANCFILLYIIFYDQFHTVVTQKLEKWMIIAMDLQTDAKPNLAVRPESCT